jgi:hypothetical protein
MSTAGEWLRVDEVRSGSGSMVSVDRRRAVSIPAALSADAARAIEGQRLLVNTARAGASAPITPDEVIDATRNVGPAVVTTWITASRQQFALDGQQMATLARADLPQSVLQAMMHWTTDNASQYPLNANANASAGTSSDVSSMQAGRGIYEEQPSTVYGCPTTNCYAPGIYSPYNGYSPYAYYGYGYVRPLIGYLPYSYGYPNSRNSNGQSHNANGRDQNHGRGDGRVDGRGDGRFDGRGPVGVRPPVTHQPASHAEPYRPAPQPQPAAHAPASRPRGGRP